MKHVALVIAGGTGVRVGMNIPKQFLLVEDKPVIIYTLEVFEQSPLIDSVFVVCVSGWEEKLREYAKIYNITKLEKIIIGGANGQDSIRNGLFEIEKIYNENDMVLIHDSVRPMLSHEIIKNCIDTAEKYGNAITAIPCVEAMLQTNDGKSSKDTYPRDNLKRTQTPQAFRLGEICNVHREALEKGITNSIASCTLMIETGRQVYFSKGSEINIKLTTPDDLDIFKALLLTRGKDKKS